MELNLDMSGLAVAAAVTLVTVVGIIPYIALQVKAPSPDGLGLHGSGLFIVNPPWKFSEQMFHHEYEYKPELVDGHYYPNRTIVINKELPERTDAYGFHHGYTTISKIAI